MSNNILPFDEFKAKFTQRIIQIQAQQHAFGMLGGHGRLPLLLGRCVGCRKSIVPRCSLTHRVKLDCVFLLLLYSICVPRQSNKTHKRNSLIIENYDDTRLLFKQSMQVVVDLYHLLFFFFFFFSFFGYFILFFICLIFF